jgi:hypothetical protein
MQITFLSLENFVTKSGKTFHHLILENAIEKYNKQVLRGCAFGEVFLGEMKGAIVNLVEVSHNVDSITIVKNGVRITINILDTEMGKYVKANPNIDWDLRYRATGSVNEHNVIQEFNITSFDLVDGSQSPYKDD